MQMTNVYRSIVLVGLLVGLIVNAVATYQVKSDIVSMNDRITELSATISTAQMKSTTAIAVLETKTTTQFTEHERLIDQLENMLNYQLDN